MKKLLPATLLLVLTVNLFSQAIYKTYNFNVKPKMDKSADGIWKPFKLFGQYIDKDTIYYDIPRSADSLYISSVGLPNFDDLGVPDLETKVKSLWYGDSVFFLFQRLDDIWVTGYNDNESVDTTVKEGLENRDASTIYFYLSCDSARLTKTYNFLDSVAWLRFGWKSNDIEGRLPSGDTVYSLEDFHAEAVQWSDGAYNYAKIGISLYDLAPFVSDVMESQVKNTNIGFAYFGFAIDACENDKEVGEDIFGLQTRAFWPSSFGASALEHVPDWGWLYFKKDKFQYTGIQESKIEYASIFPNPANEYLNISLLDGYNPDYRLIDIMGREVLSGTLSERESSLSLQNLPAGSYFLVLTDKKANSLTRNVLILR
jgi:hypothetical protein